MQKVIKCIHSSFHVDGQCTMCQKIFQAFKQGEHGFMNGVYICIFPILYTISVYDATTFSKKSFIEWVEGAVFTPAQGIGVEVTTEYGGSVPLPKCRDCENI